MLLTGKGGMRKNHTRLTGSGVKSTAADSASGENAVTSNVPGATGQTMIDPKYIEVCPEGEHVSVITVWRIDGELRSKCLRSRCPAYAVIDPDTGSVLEWVNG
jgi:hypothetical protein